MTIKERPHLDRDRLCREERARRRLRALLRRTLATLAPGERLGEPFREGDRMVIPIVTTDEEASDDALSMHALVAAWLDEPTL